MSISVTIGKLIKAYRIKAGLSQDELAFASKLDRTYISKLERGINQPTILTLISLSRPLKIRPSDFIRLLEKEIKYKLEEDNSKLEEE